MFLPVPAIAVEPDLHGGAIARDHAATCRSHPEPSAELDDGLPVDIADLEHTMAVLCLLRAWRRCRWA